ncbi:MAG: hypothetical protein JW936_09725 [Sedimentisphaerales bacterium]|nr:hypothetical protein [Sedimentisphaerales bacterium]
MNKVMGVIFIGLMGLVVLAGGCQQEALVLEQAFSQIQVGTSTAAEVLGALPDEGMMHTANAISVYDTQAYTREAGIVCFSSTDSTTERLHYVQTRSQQSIWFLKENLYMRTQTLVPQEVLDAPYENETRRLEAILRYCHEMMVQDAAPFSEDVATESMMGMSFTALGMGLLAISENPREAVQMTDERGFSYTHQSLGKCRIFLNQDSNQVFTLIIRGEKWVDPFTTW